MRVLEYLGVVLDLESLTFSLPEEKVLKILSLFHKSQRLERISRRELEKIVGFLNFAAGFIKWGKLFLKPIQRWMNSHTSVSQRDTLLVVDEEFREAFLPWAREEFLRTPISFVNARATKELMTDASEDGWAGVLLPNILWGDWPQEWKNQSMNWNELKAVHLALTLFHEELEGSCVMVLSDSMTALSCLRKEGSLASVALGNLTEEICLF